MTDTTTSTLDLSVEAAAQMVKAIDASERLGDPLKAREHLDTAANIVEDLHARLNGEGAWDDSRLLEY